MLGRDARGGASQSAQGSSAGRSAAEREREERMQQLAAWRLQKEQQKRRNPDKSLAASRSGKQAFNTMATSAQSDAERQRLLQRRKELMRPPSAKKAAQQLAKETQSQRPAPRATSTTSTATDAETSSAETTATDEAIARALDYASEDEGKPTHSREYVDAQPSSATVASHPAAPESPTPTRLRKTDENTQKTTASPTTRLRTLSRDASPLAQRTPSPGPTPVRAVPPFSPSKQSPKVIAHTENQHVQAPSAVTVPVPQPPALYAPRPPPPRVVRLPEALVVDKRLPVRPPVSSPPVSVAAPTPPPTSPDAQASSVGSPESGLGAKTFVLKTQPSPSKAAKQVRFADQVHNAPELDTAGELSRLMERGNGALEGEDGQDDGEPHNPLQDSQSSIDREIRQTEVLMSEVDELLSFHKTETIVTDQLVHLHRDGRGEELVEEEIIETRTEETSLVHVEEEITVEAPAVAAVNQLVPLSEPEVSRLDATGPSQPIEEHAANHVEELQSTSEHPVPSHPESPKLSAARPPVASAAGEIPPQRPSPLGEQQREQVTNRTPKPERSRRSKVNVRAVVELSLVVICIFLLDYFYPWSPVSKGIRVAIRAAGAIAVYVTSRGANWLWKNVFRPTTESTCAKLADADGIWSPSARALQSLVHEGGEGIASILRRDFKLPVYEYGRAVFKSVSSRIADMILYAAGPLIKPLPKIDPSTASHVEHRLEDLNDAQQELEVKVKEILRTHEEWALEELERMKLRRVTYAAATKSILRETSRTMLEAVREAKLAAADHIEAFTNRLAGELMVSIQPNLEEYERSQADKNREQAHIDAQLKKEKLEAAARLEILRIEVAKKQAAAKLGEDIAAAHEQLTGDAVAEEVDLMEVVEAAEEVIGDDAVRAVEEIEAGFEANVEEAARIAKKKEAEVDMAAIATEHDIEVATAQVLKKLEDDVAARKEDLRLKHDAVKEEIRRAASMKLEILEAELLAAEELARERLRAEENLLEEAAEAHRALDELFLEDAERLERELVAAAEAAAAVEFVEVEQVIVENELAKQALETQVVKEVETLVDEIYETEVEIISSVGAAETQLGVLGVAAEAAIESMVLEEIERQEAERVLAAAAIDSVTAQVEQAIASSAGIENPSDLLSRDTNTKAIHSATSAAPLPVVGKVYDETELRHMVLLSIGFVVLGIVTAFVLYPRYARHAVAPVKDPKQWTMDRRRRRRRRSWQRAAELTDSEVEEVILLQTGSSSDDGLSDSNEPEPEVVEFMRGDSETPERSWQHRTATTTATTTITTTATISTSLASSFARQFAEENALPEAAQQREEAAGEEEQASDTPQRRGLRRRTRRA